MRLKRLLTTILTAVACSTFADATGVSTANPPPLPREFRGVWVATVGNIDWPSAAGLPVEQQKKELIDILDECKKLKLNAVVFQVRPNCDAFYASKLEPWSEFLTGQIGQAPEPQYDPLQFAVEEAHARGMELHAWINPYRAGKKGSKSAESPYHISKKHPEMVLEYGKHLWLDPGKKSVQNYVISIVEDIVKRYDIDGFHLDDYFYPYRERNEMGQEIIFPDEPTFMEYVAQGGTATIDDWRRENVNKLVKRCNMVIKAEKPWVKFGISPFGIWQPGYPATIHGMNSFQEIYCDSLKWLTNGWADYFSPQLYWKIDATEQSYPVLLKWWSEQNVKGRHIWPGNFTSRVSPDPSEKEKRWSSDEIINQIKLTRQQNGAGGNVHFSMKPLMQNKANLSDALAAGLYAEPALVPASDWLGTSKPAKPAISLEHGNAGVKLTWKAKEPDKVFQWVLEQRVAGKWMAEIHPADTTSQTVTVEKGASAPDAFAVLALNRYGQVSAPAVVENRP